MATRYKGSILSSTAQTPSSASAKGIWKKATVLQAQKAGTWPTLYTPIVATYLVVAGGGAGGSYYYGGGGGAGGLLTNNGGTAFTIPQGSGAYAVIVGGGEEKNHLKKLKKISQKKQLNFHLMMFLFKI